MSGAHTGWVCFLTKNTTENVPSLTMENWFGSRLSRVDRIVRDLDTAPGTAVTSPWGLQKTPQKSQEASSRLSQPGRG